MIITALGLIFEYNSIVMYVSFEVLNRMVAYEIGDNKPYYETYNLTYINNLLFFTHDGRKNYMTEYGIKKMLLSYNMGIYKNVCGSNTKYVSYNREAKVVDNFLSKHRIKPNLQNDIQIYGLGLIIRNGEAFYFINYEPVRALRNGEMVYNCDTGVIKIYPIDSLEIIKKTIGIDSYIDSDGYFYINGRDTVAKISLRDLYRIIFARSLEKCDISKHLGTEKISICRNMGSIDDIGERIESGYDTEFGTHKRRRKRKIN